MNNDPRRLRIVLAVLVLAAFTLITLDYRAGKSGPLSSLRNAVSDVVDPVVSAFSGVFRPVGNIVGDLGHAGGEGRRARSLQQQVDSLQAQLRDQGDVTAQRAELQQLLTFSAGQRFSVIPAQVVGVGDASGFDDTVLIDVGTADGVTDDATVIAGTTRGGGLVGRVVQAGRHTATVAVIIDPDVSVSSRLHNDADLSVNGIGLTSGHGLAPLTFTGLDPSVRPSKGNVVETSGSPLYTAGIPIGTVSAVAPTAGATSLTASVIPFFDYASLDVVGVIAQPSRTSAAHPVLPTVTVSTTVTVTQAPPTTPTVGSGSGSGTPGVTPSSSRRP